MSERQTFTSVRVVGSHVPISIHTRVTSTADDQSLTDTPTSDQVVNSISPAFTFTAVLRADRITITRCTINQSINQSININRSIDRRHTGQLFLKKGKGNGTLKPFLFAQY